MNEKVGAFANNDLQHEDPTGADHPMYTKGLNLALHNYLNGVGFDIPMQDWFEFEVPKPSHFEGMIKNFLN